MGCTKLATLNFPSVTQIYGSAFRSCTSLTTISSGVFPSALNISTYAFANCTKITDVYFPKVSTIGTYAFNSCSSMTMASFPNATNIGTNAFRSCYRLISLYLLGSSMVTLAAGAAFTSTPISTYSTVAGRYGSIYVPASLYASYKTAIGWSAFSSRFVSV